MIKRLVAIAPFAALLACAGPDDMRQQPVVWSAVYQAPYDVMANCVAIESTGFARAATPLIDAKSKRAEVLVYGSPYGNMIEQFGFQEVNSGTTVAEYRGFLLRSPLSANNVADKRLLQCSRAS